MDRRGGRHGGGGGRGGELKALLILVHSATWEARYQASALAASAVAAGQTVHLALFFAALEAWVEGRWDDPEPADAVTAERLAAADHPPLTDLLAPGREAGTLHLHACSASTRILGLSTTDVQQTVDALAGWPTFHRLMRGAERVVSF